MSRCTRSRALVAATASLLLAPLSTIAAPSLTPIATFGGGDGWRSPTEVLAGDTPGTATGGTVYNYLGTASLERGLDYNPATGNLILVSRSTAGNGIRILDGATGVDEGSLAQGTGIISGGTFATNMVGVAGDGAIYVGNLAGNTNTNGLKIYQWTSESASAPTTLVPATTTTAVTGTGTATPRLGDSLDVTGSGSSTRIVAGFTATGAPPAGSLNGYAVYDNTGALTVVNPITDANNGDFRLGITFAGSANDVWGKQTGSANPLRRSSYTGSTGTLLGSNTLTSAGEMALDYATIAGVPYLATLDANNSLVRIYDATDPANLALVISGTTTSGTLSGNANATGAIAWGAIDGYNATLYAMSTNQGIQALTFTVPEPATLSLLALAPLATLRRRRA